MISFCAPTELDFPIIKRKMGRISNSFQDRKETCIHL